MADARGTTLSLRITGMADGGQRSHLLGKRPHHHLRRVPVGLRRDLDDLAGGEADDAESTAAAAEPGQRVDADRLTPDGHTTSPPPRYTEASLIKSLEELGIGRPSTYSSIIKTIQDRGYVHKKGSALVPSWVAFAVTGLLEQHFGRLVDYGFTAAMEDELDEIANGHEQRTVWLTNFYFGGEHGVPGIDCAGGRAEETGRRQPRRHRRARSQLHHVV